MDVTFIAIPETNYDQGRFYDRNSRNHPASIQYGVIHWFGQGNLAATDKEFRRSGAQKSATFAVEGNQVHQYVKLSDTPFSNGNYAANAESVTFEFSAEPGRPAAPETVETGCRLIAETFFKIGKRPVLYPHRKFYNTECCGTMDVDYLQKRSGELYDQLAAQGIDQPVITGNEISAILASAPAHAVNRLPLVGPNGYVQTRITARWGANVRSRCDRLDPADILETIPFGEVQDVMSIVDGCKPDGKNGKWFVKPNGRCLWTGTTGYDGTNL